MSRYQHNSSRAVKTPGDLLGRIFGQAGHLRSQILRLTGAIVVAGLAVGTLAGVTAAARNAPTVLVQTSANPDELTIARLAAVEVTDLELSPIAFYDDLVPERLDETLLAVLEEPVLEEPVMPGAPDALAALPRARIAIIIDDLGLHVERARKLADLGVPLTLSWLPYAENLKTQTQYGYERGHQIFAHVPMQPGGDEDPGANALMIFHGKTEIKNLLDSQLSEFTGLTGINNHMGSRFTSNRMSMTWFMAEVKARDLLFVDSLTSPRSEGANVAKTHGLPFIQRDFFIDHEAKGNAGLITKRLEDLEALALERSEVVAIGHPYAVTIAGLEAWIPQAQARGIEFITVSRLKAAEGRGDAVLMAQRES